MRNFGSATALALALAALSGAPANAQLHLAVADCGGPRVLNNTCASNTGTLMLVGTLIPATVIAQAAGIHAEVHLIRCAGDQTPFGDWWHFEPGGCREGALTAVFDASMTCADAWNGAATGSVSCSFPAPNHAEFSVDASLPTGTTAALDAGVEYVLFTLRISRVSTVMGCIGCVEPLGLEFQNLLVTQDAAAGGDVALAGDPAEDMVLYNWGGWSGPPPVCEPYRDPIFKSTWGAVKAIYR